MEPNKLLLLVFALSVVAADIFVRLRYAPGRRDRSVEALLDMLVPSDGHRRTNASATLPLANPVANSLLKHFEQSFASRHIVAALAETPRGMTEQELERRFAEVAGRSGKRALPTTAIRKVIMILMSADFVSLSGGKLRMTSLGKSLHTLLQARREMNS